MSWRDSLRQASFKGVDFKIDNHEMEFGKRVDVSEFPYKDIPYVEDLGSQARRFQISGYVLGESYHRQRDSLITALESGQGLLIHPYLGSFEVVPGACRVSESNKEGGFCVFSMSFVEAGEKVYPKSSPVPLDLVFAGSDNLISEARSLFINELSLQAVPEFIRDYQSESYSSAGDLFNEILKTGGINNQIDIESVNQASEWVADVSDLLSPVSETITNITSTADKIINIFKGVFDLSPSDDIAIKNLSRFETFSSPKSSSTTSQARISQTNADVTETFFKTVSLANESKAIVSKKYESYDEAITARKAFLSRIDSIAQVTNNDSVFNALRELRKEVALAVPCEDEDLPRIKPIQLSASMPSLVVSYDIYGDVSRESQILERNSIRHPGFMPGGTDIEVLQID